MSSFINVFLRKIFNNIKKNRHNAFGRSYQLLRLRDNPEIFKRRHNTQSQVESRALRGTLVRIVIKRAGVTVTF